MRILFQLVHPSKYQLHKVTINRLISENHDVDVLIQKKDVLETLVRDEEWNYFNLFPIQCQMIYFYYLLMLIML